MPQMGDISARSALTIHRGTAISPDQSRPVIVLGIAAPDGRNADKHDLQVTARYHASLPDEVRQHLNCRMVNALIPPGAGACDRRAVDGRRGLASFSTNMRGQNPFAIGQACINAGSASFSASNQALAH
jgi:hypothetical protein